MRRLLVVKLADLGDVLICEPALRSLRLGYPTAEIDILVPPASAGIVELIGHNIQGQTFPKHAFDEVAALADPRNLLLAAGLARRLRARRYDAVVILHHLTTAAGAAKFRALAAASGAPVVAGLDNGRGTFLTHRVTDQGFGALHEAEYMLAVAQVVGGMPTTAAPRVTLDTAAADFDLPPRYVAIYPATGPYSSARTWPAARFANVALALHERGWPVVVAGAVDATEAGRTMQRLVPSALDLTGQTSIAQLASVVSGAAAVVGGDSFIGHLAAALGRPVVSIFGPSNVDAWKPFGGTLAGDNADVLARGIVVRHELPCEPCIYTGYSLGRPAGCPARTCLTMVSEDMVLHATLRVLEAG